MAALARWTLGGPAGVQPAARYIAAENLAADSCRLAILPKSPSLKHALDGVVVMGFLSNAAAYVASRDPLPVQRLPVGSSGVAEAAMRPRRLSTACNNNRAAGCGMQSVLRRRPRRARHRSVSIEPAAHVLGFPRHARMFGPFNPLVSALLVCIY